MRIEGFIPHPKYKITVFKSGLRYILKLETSDFEQSVKFRDGEVQGITDIRTLLDQKWLDAIDLQFNQLLRGRVAALRRRKSQQADDIEEII